ncbi:hypothetical protein QC764_309500 [Podospora pseudoanserina]|uniref:Glycine zipper 2TM domain-containing protein n=1 Tax=Podospora pseudoanserina TaxID=2609844 RepID=A0ABR0IEX4_9PEZI|nr:hypothetical protein QC764_309500 [Podospora pseudoanserina]
MPRSYRSDSSPEREREDYYRPSRHRSVTPGPNTRGPSRPRDYSPSSRGGGRADEYYASGALQERHPHFEYEDHTPFYRPDPRDRDTLQIPRDGYRRSSRPRTTRTSTDDSLTTGTTYTGDTTTIIPRSSRGRSRSSSSSSSRSSSPDIHHRKRGPIRQAKKSLQETFTPSTSGLGVGVLGAIVGGLAAREAVEHLPPKSRSKSRSGSHSKSKHDKVAVLGTVLGAAIGGLGANAIERHIERKKGIEESWGRREGELARLEERVKEAEGGRDREYERGRRY